jgi:hypothetical protein
MGGQEVAQANKIKTMGLGNQVSAKLSPRFAPSPVSCIKLTAPCNYPQAFQYFLLMRLNFVPGDGPIMQD